MNGTGKSPLTLPGWLEFNRLKWGLRTVRVDLSSSPDRGDEAILYINQRGQVCLPPRNPYLACSLTNQSTKNRDGRHWHRTDFVQPLVQEMRERGLAGPVALPPVVVDVRPWQWAGFQAGVKYTFYNRLPLDFDRVHRSILRSVKKARRAGFSCARSRHMAQVYDCLAAAEARQGFKHLLTVRDLETALDILGEEHFRSYACYDARGEVAGASIWLHRAGAPALGWVGGATENGLRMGAAQLLYRYVLEDLHAAGATGVDWCGANIPGVASVKARWGGDLLPYYTITPYDVKQLARCLRNWLVLSWKGGE